jgi:glycosyltransferase involved in cell wall biosynthesis
MADICLIVEGAYPYVTGGVSSWIQSLVTNLPDVTFAIMYIGSVPDPGRKLAYKMPDNVIEFREVFISDINRVRKPKRTTYAASAWHEFSALHEAIAVGKPYDTQRLLSILRQPGVAGLTASDLFHARESWEVMVKLYEQYAAEQPFVDFLWTFRFTYLTIFSIFEVSLPQAQVYHAVSTGFGGLLGSLGKIRTGCPFLVTEHGLYTREREIEISQSAWMGQSASRHRIDTRRMGFFQQWWFNMFLFMEKLCYDSADVIVAITGVNQKYQLKRGADPQKLQLISNGINIQQLAHLRQQATRAGGQKVDFTELSSIEAVDTRELQSISHELSIQQLTHLHRREVRDWDRSTLVSVDRVMPRQLKVRLKRWDDQQTAYPPLQEDHPPGSDRFQVGFVGRVVPIKDIKTFIRALKIASQTIPNLQAYLVGPTDEDAEYFQACQQLVEMLDLASVLRFTGSADVKKFYSQIDVLVLTSLSEGQPLVILEGNCAGVPVVATDVGACRELLMGVSPEDQDLGASGLITPVASPQETAAAIIQLWRDKDLRLRMGRAGQERTQRYYRQEQLYHSYAKLYQRFLVQKDWR